MRGADIFHRDAVLVMADFIHRKTKPCRVAGWEGQGRIDVGNHAIQIVYQ